MLLVPGGCMWCMIHMPRLLGNERGNWAGPANSVESGEDPVRNAHPPSSQATVAFGHAAQPQMAHLIWCAASSGA